MTIPADLARLMELNVNDEVKISFDPVTREMIVSRELTRIVTRKEAEILLLLQNARVYLPRGHYILDSNKHSPDYAHIRLALAHDQYARQIGQVIVDLLNEERIDAVAGFTVGGFKLAQAVSTIIKAKLIIGEKLGFKNKKTEVVFYNLDEMEKGDRVLLVDDVLTTGGSLRAAIDAVEKARLGIIVDVAVVVDRSQRKHIDLDVNLLSLTSISFTEYEDTVCPMCKEALPKVDLSRADFDENVTLGSLPESQKPIMTQAYEDFRKMVAEVKSKRTQDERRHRVE